MSRQQLATSLRHEYFHEPKIPYYDTYIDTGLLTYKHKQTPTRFTVEKNEVTFKFDRVDQAPWGGSLDDLKDEQRVFNKAYHAAKSLGFNLEAEVNSVGISYRGTQQFSSVEEFKEMLRAFEHQSR